MNLKLPYLATFALVQWPDAHDKTLPSCITVEGIPKALAGGAQLIAREWDMADPLIDAHEPRPSSTRHHDFDGA